MKWAENCENTFRLTINSFFLLISRLTACIVCCSAHLTLSLCSVHVQYYCSESVFVSSLCCSVELDFKLQEDKLQPLMKRLYPADESLFPPLPYPQETISSTPKRKSKRRPRNTRAGNSGFCDRRITHNWSSYFQYRSLSAEHRYRSICSLDLFFDQDDSGKSYQIVFLFVFLALLVLYGREYWTRFGNTATSINKKIIIYIYVYLTEFWNFLLEKWNNETISLMQSVKLF